MTASKSVTLTKGNREVTLTLPRDIVEYKAAGWREKPAKRAAAPAADTKADDSPKGGAKK
jgi:hypothetical protein